MLKLEERIDALEAIGDFIQSNKEEWLRAKRKAFTENAWFTEEFVNLATTNIAQKFLQRNQLQALASQYALPDIKTDPVTVGIVMAGNIPLVGFHDFLCVFISGHIARIKPSSKDQALITEIVKFLHEQFPETHSEVSIEERLTGCEAYIATGSNNSARYFEHYFGKFPSIIRKNRTSVAVLTGSETDEELERLADDVYQYFGLGCRNVTKIFVPHEYDFEKLLNIFSKYNYLADHNKYKNNYDYNFAVHLLNKKYYMTNGSILLVEEPSIFSPIAQLNYEFYDDKDGIMRSLSESEDVQCIVAASHADFGEAQTPGICDFADGVDTMAFLQTLKK